MTTLPKVQAWSYSRWSDYDQCPSKFMYKHLMKLPDPGNAAMARGNAIHKLAEDFVKGKTKKLPPELAGVKDQIAHMRDNNAIAEQMWGFKNSWDWIGRSGWFGDDVWFRAKADVVVTYDDDTLLLVDWKTGKKYLSNEDQVRLFALAGFKRFPNVTEVDTRLFYTDSPADDNEIQFTYTLADAKLIQKDWDKKVTPMFKDRKFAPKPNQWCSRCAFSKGNGGPCRF